MNTIDIIAIVLIVLSACARRGSLLDFQRHMVRLESLGYSSVPMMMTDPNFMKAYRHVKGWSTVLRVLLVGYAASWVVTLLA